MFSQKCRSPVFHSLAIAFFSVEYVARLVVCPKKWKWEFVEKNKTELMTFPPSPGLSRTAWMWSTLLRSSRSTSRSSSLVRRCFWSDQMLQIRSDASDLHRLSLDNYLQFLSGKKMLWVSITINILIILTGTYYDDLSLDHTWRLRVARHEDHQQGRHHDQTGQYITYSFSNLISQWNIPPNF